MRDFIDKTNEEQGTPINRANLMAIQGFDTREIVADDTGSVFTCTNSLGEILTITFDDYINKGSQKIIETFTGEKTITKTTDISNGVISEVLA